MDIFHSLSLLRSIPYFDVLVNIPSTHVLEHTPIEDRRGKLKMRKVASLYMHYVDVRF